MKGNTVRRTRRQPPDGRGVEDVVGACEDCVLCVGMMYLMFYVCAFGGPWGAADFSNPKAAIAGQAIDVPVCARVTWLQRHM